MNVYTIPFGEQEGDVIVLDRVYLVTKVTPFRAVRYAFDLLFDHHVSLTLHHDDEKVLNKYRNDLIKRMRT